ncbi:hypothetical protein BDW69DRAFT_154452 [Aspergillus filifer]
MDCEESDSGVALHLHTTPSPMDRPRSTFPRFVPGSILVIVASILNDAAFRCFFSVVETSYSLMRSISSCDGWISGLFSQAQTR